MHKLLMRVTLTVFITTGAVLLALIVVVNHEIAENFTSYLNMSGMHGMMQHGMTKPPAMGLPEQEFLRSLKHSLLLVGSLMLGCGAIISYYLARSITGPMLTLNKAVKSVAAGNLDTCVIIQRKDELGQLAAAFNEMTKQLKATTILRQRFFAGIAHELRTPLTILKANLEGIADGVITPDKEQMASLTEEVDRLTKLVEELRDLSFLEAGQLKPEFRELDIGSILYQIVQKSQPLASDKSLALTCTIKTQLKPIHADITMIQQIIYNLIINAIRYTNTGSIQVIATQNSTSTIIEVIDTGIGINPEDLPYIFDYFYRVDLSRTKQSGGTGLGLALVQQMALTHKGNISVQSELDKGSTFRLTLPFKIH